MNYQFTGSYVTFYPHKSGEDGPGLMVAPGGVVDFPGSPPDDGHWMPAEASPEVPPAAPEPAPGGFQAVPQPAPEPDPVPSPEPVPAPEPAPEAPPVPEPDPQPAMTADWFAALASVPPVRA